MRQCFCREIQIVDTRSSLKSRTTTGFAADTIQFNRTLVAQYINLNPITMDERINGLHRRRRFMQSPSLKRSLPHTDNEPDGRSCGYDHETDASVQVNGKLIVQLR